MNDMLNLLQKRNTEYCKEREAVIAKLTPLENQKKKLDEKIGAIERLFALEGGTQSIGKDEHYNEKEIDHELIQSPGPLTGKTGQEAYKKLLETDPEIPDSYYTYARLLKFDSQHHEVIPVLDAAINAGLSFSDPEHQIFAAEAYELLGRFSDALYWYDQAFKSTGNDRIEYKTNELSEMTQKDVPQSLDEFFPFNH